MTVLKRFFTFVGEHSNQILTTWIACLTVFGVGCSVGWSSPALKKVKEGAVSGFRLTSGEAGWVASSHEVGHLLAPLPAAGLASRTGRRFALAVAATLLVAGWIITTVSRSFWLLLTARFLFGLAQGVVSTVVPLYIAEIAAPKIRGALSISFQMSLYLGHVVEFSVGPYSSYTLLAALSLALSALFFMFLWFMVESPHDLVRRGNHAGARNALRWLRKTTDHEVLEREMKEVEAWVARQAVAGRERVKATLRAWRPLVVVCGVAVAQRMTGMSAVTAYASSTFPSTEGGLNADMYSTLFALVVFLTSFISAALVDTAGRRPVLLISCGGCGAAHLLTAYYFFHPSPKASFIPFLTISSFAVFYSFGLGPLPDTLKGELLPANARLLASAIATVCHGLSSMAVTKLFQVVKDDLYVYINFLIFGFSCFLSLLLSYKFVPETKSKTLTEVQGDQSTHL